jgi:hypothetical protein
LVATGSEHALLDLRDVLRRLAAPAPDQIAYLRSIGVAPIADELALELDDAVRALPTLVAEGCLTAEQARRISTLDRKLESMSGGDNARLWTENALRQSVEWEQVRLLAATALAQLPEPTSTT